MDKKNTNFTLVVIPGEHRAFARDVREGDPGVKHWRGVDTWVPFPSPLRGSAGNDNFGFGVALTGGISQ